MSANTSIQWTDATWNPTRGCSRVSPGCQNCYAERTAARQMNSGYAGLVRSTPQGPRWTGGVRVVEDALTIPLRWRKPRRIFVDSMSDLFHDAIEDAQIDRVLAVMLIAQSGATRCVRPYHEHGDGECRGFTFAPHTFQVLTKRADRMAAYFATPHREDLVRDACHSLPWTFSDEIAAGVPWPLPNVWLGVSVEDQQRADERIPHLLAVPAAVRFLSVEPLLGPVDLRIPLARFVEPGHTLHGADGLNVNTLCGVGGGSPIPALDWVIVGGESGPGARPCDVAWIRRVVEDCREAGVPCFVKQFGANAVRGGTSLNLREPKGGDPMEWFHDLRVREFPTGEKA